MQTFNKNRGHNNINININHPKLCVFCIVVVVDVNASIDFTYVCKYKVYCVMLITNFFLVLANKAKCSKCV